MANKANETVRDLGTSVFEQPDAMNGLPRLGIERRTPALAIVYGLTLGVLAVAVLTSVRTGVPIAFFVRDPSVTLRGDPLTGALSNLGALVWCVAAGICFFTRAILPRAQGHDPMRPFLFWSGLITSVLLLDDFFLLHDALIPRYLGLSEKLIFLSYGMVTAWYLLRFRRIVLGSEYAVLFVALVGFALSILIDAFQSRWPSPWRILFEDGFKLLGIVSWSTYLIRTCARAAELGERTQLGRPAQHERIRLDATFAPSVAARVKSKGRSEDRP
jgi:hypothetical protein